MTESTLWMRSLYCLLYCLLQQNNTQQTTVAGALLSFLFLFSGGLGGNPFSGPFPSPPSSAALFWATALPAPIPPLHSVSQSLAPLVKQWSPSLRVAKSWCLSLCQIGGCLRVGQFIASNTYRKVQTKQLLQIISILMLLKVPSTKRQQTTRADALQRKRKKKSMLAHCDIL